MSFTIAISPHGHNQKSTSTIMRITLFALVPAIATQCYLFGWGVLFQLLVAMLTALISEALILKLRGFVIAPSLKDSSALLTAALIAVAVPPLLPWWMTAVAVAFSIIIAKQLYGGLGQNLFNPAMIGYVFLLVSFPASMTNWQPPIAHSQHILTVEDTARVIFQGKTTSQQSVFEVNKLIDGTTMATPLDRLKTELKQGTSVPEIIQKDNFKAGSIDGWRWINLSFIVSGFILLITRVITWQASFAMIFSLGLCSLIANTIAPGHFAGPEIELLSGATMLGAFFIVTDPVTSSTTYKGRFIFGALVGLLVFIIRHFGGYPDGVAFSVILTNILVPFIDKFSQSRVYGH